MFPTFPIEVGEDGWFRVEDWTVAKGVHEHFFLPIPVQDPNYYTTVAQIASWGIVIKGKDSLIRNKLFWGEGVLVKHIWNVENVLWRLISK